ncbi:MAG: glycosyltransferase family 2 protein [Patescibacteria group bacterium]|nr:glycosyltransferase family 2 protein [Patescibacteria group bacterium]
MKYSNEDLEVFILTYNRPRLLEQTLLSFVHQTIKGFKLTVIDNGSTDREMKQMKKKIINWGYNYMRLRKNLNPSLILEPIKPKMKTKLFMLFHDDDLIHPDYLRQAINLFNRYPETIFIGSAMSFDSQPEKLSWPNFTGEFEVFDTVNDFAAFIYKGFPLHFASVVYVTRYFKEACNPFDVYGKIADRPFLFDMAGNKKREIIVLMECYIRYRTHNNQDSQNVNTGPFKDQLFALHRRYRELLGDNILTANGRIFVRKNYEYLYLEALKLKKTISPEEYIIEALEKGATTRLAINYGRLHLYLKRLLGYG